MPYISPHKRELLDDTRPTSVRARWPQDPGELNYVLSQEINEYLDGKRGYFLFNEVIGVLECLKLEIYRRLVARLEDEKMATNGDVFDERLLSE